MSTSAIKLTPPFRKTWRRETLIALKDSLKFQATYLGISWFHASALEPLFAANPNSYMGRYLCARPETAGILIWPYQCAAWDRYRRVSRFVGHFKAMEVVPAYFRFGFDEKLVLLDLSMYSPDCVVILDQPRWLCREGQLTLNIFQGKYRAFSLTFSLYAQQGLGTEMFIGGIQGRSTDDALERYRQLTKSFFGLRPRDLLLELLNSLAPVLGVTKINAVADQHRYFRHRFFRSADKPIHVDYDDIWMERGAVRVEETYFELPMTPYRRDLEDVSSNKRSMYRRRYQALEQFKLSISASDGARLINFEAN